MVHRYSLKPAMPDHAVETEFMLHALQLVERAGAVQRLDDAAGDRKTFGVALAIGRHHVVGAHGVFDPVRLNITRRRQDRRGVDAVGIHDAHAIGVVAILPAVAFLQAAAIERTQVMVNIDNFHIASLPSYGSNE